MSLASLALAGAFFTTVPPGNPSCNIDFKKEMEAQEYWSGLPFPSSGDLSDPGIQPVFPALAGRFFTTEPPGKPIVIVMYNMHNTIIYNKTYYYF